MHDRGGGGSEGECGEFDDELFVAAVEDVFSDGGDGVIHWGFDSTGWVVGVERAVGLDTLYYGEFRNHGPSSDTGLRVQWPGFSLMNVTEAVNFTVYNLTTGDTWLSYADVSFTGGLFSLN
ncbi:Probable pectinesterase/pectinesterase inhibitor 25 [Linum perenne]